MFQVYSYEQIRAVVALMFEIFFHRSVRTMTHSSTNILFVMPHFTLLSSISKSSTEIAKRAVSFWQLMFFFLVSVIIFVLLQDDHPSPGTWYKGITRKAYLPNNSKGKQICAMLKVAFERKLVFTIGRSRTTGADGVITWNDIHHKTDPRPNSQ